MIDGITTLGLHALLMEILAPKVLTEDICSLLYV